MLPNKAAGEEELKVKVKTEVEELPIKEETPELTTVPIAAKPDADEKKPAVIIKPIVEMFELLDDIADFHATLQKKAKERVGLVGNIGPFRRALCARRDLAIRRALCKVEKVRFCCLDSLVLVALVVEVFSFKYLCCL